MCQFTNLIYWLILHTPLDIIEHHHHYGIDLFPDYGRQIPFGTGTSILYNYLDYRFKNNTDQTYQLIVTVDEVYINAQIRTENPLKYKYHIKVEDEKFIRQNDNIFRTSKIYKEQIDVKTGNLVKKTLVKENFAKLMYEICEEKITII